MTDDDRQHRKRTVLEVLDRWATPEELSDFFRVLGSPKDAAEFHSALKGLVEQRRWRNKTLSNIKEASLWITVVGAAVTLLYGIAGWLQWVPLP